MLERAGNYGVPLALLFFLLPVRGWKSWFEQASPLVLSPGREALVWRTLSLTTALLLLGHGALAMKQKAVLVLHAGVFGLGADAAVLVGALEIALAFAVLAAPRPGLLVSIALWKISTEILWPATGAPIGEFIERGGSYAAPLALAVLALARVAAVRVRTVSLSGGVAGLATVLTALSVAPSLANAQQQERARVEDKVPIAPPGIFEKLQRGGFVIACRHAATDHSKSDRGPGREQQRNLTQQGENDAKSISAAIQALGIKISDVLSTTVYRNQETAAYAFGTNVVDTSLFRTSALRSYFSRSVPEGTNRAVVLRQGGIYDALADFGVRTTQEGDCFVIEPRENAGFDVLARQQIHHWKEAVNQVRL